MKQPPEIVYTGMHEVIGNPTDYSNNKQNSGFGRQVDLRIPTHKTDQKKPVKIGANGLIDDGSPDYGHQEYQVDPQPISSSLTDNFNNMNIRSPINNPQPRVQHHFEE